MKPLTTGEPSRRPLASFSPEEKEDDTHVLNAHKLTNPLEPIPECASFTCTNGSTGTLKHCMASELSAKQLNWLMDLMKRNMKYFYKKSQDNWNARKKQKEMTQKTSRYLIATVNDKPVAFTHFQFDMDYGRQVLYCYEIQLEPSVRRFGLGKHIMKTLEEIASSTRLTLVVLTVFKHNPSALEFFQRVGYEIDETCPEEEEGKDYFIMSRRMQTTAADTEKCLKNLQL